MALTFDDGPGEHTQAVLDVLAAHGVLATFFVVGDAINGSTATTLAEMSATGHSVQNHSRSHPQLASLPDAQIAVQLSLTSDRVETATGVRPTCFRPPYGSTSPRVASVAAQQGLTQVMWNVDTSDYERPGTGTIAHRALASADGRPLTILMHDGGGGRGQTVSALGQIIDGLRARGYEFVTLCSRAAPAPPGAVRVDTAAPPLVPAETPPAGFVPVDPVRLYDSRSTGQRVPAGSVVPVDVGAHAAGGGDRGGRRAHRRRSERGWVPQHRRLRTPVPPRPPSSTTRGMRRPPRAPSLSSTTGGRASTRAPRRT